MDLQKISKWLDLNKLCLNITKSKFMLFHMPQRITPQLHLNIKGSPIENVNEFNFLGLTLGCNLNFKPHTKIIAAKISRVIGVLHKLKYIFPAYLLRMIYNSLILPHLNYSLLAWRIQCPNIELLQKKAVRVVNFKSPVAHTEPILKGMNHFLTCILANYLNYTTNYIAINYQPTLKIFYQNMWTLNIIYVTIAYVYQQLDVNLVN